ncbi:hypothetical protein NYQ47_17910 [Xanthomonas translucens pv. translucens]|nr:hypothetical protein [Xanthomonas translucens pv. translucens]
MLVRLRGAFWHADGAVIGARIGGRHRCLRQPSGRGCRRGLCLLGAWCILHRRAWRLEVSRIAALCGAWRCPGRFRRCKRNRRGMPMCRILVRLQRRARVHGGRCLGDRRLLRGMRSRIGLQGCGCLRGVMLRVLRKAHLRLLQMRCVLRSCIRCILYMRLPMLRLLLLPALGEALWSVMLFLRALLGLLRWALLLLALPGFLRLALFLFALLGFLG